MARGPSKKPAAKAKAQGNPGRRPIKTQPASAPHDPTAPDWLCERGLAIWTLYLPKLALLGYMRDTDRVAFARYCDHTARWLTVRDRMKGRETYETRSKHGKMRRINPDFLVLLRLEEKLAQLEDRFGLTPIARERVLASMNEPTKPPIIVDKPGAPGRGLPASPLAMLAPRSFARPAGGGTH